MRERIQVGQVYDTGAGLAEVVGMDDGEGGAAHFVWLDRHFDQWWTKRLAPLGWKLVPTPTERSEHE